MIRRPPRSTQGVSAGASDVYKRQERERERERERDGDGDGDRDRDRDRERDRQNRKTDRHTDRAGYIEREIENKERKYKHLLYI
eukprot:3553933-Pyramimonas_sp.AAC.1